MSAIEKQVRELALALPVMAPHTSLYTLPVETLFKICTSWLEMQKAAQTLIPSEQNPLIDMLANEAEQRGYRRGVEDAVAAGDNMAKEGTYGWVWLRATILALLEQTGDGNRPHLEIGAVAKSET